MKTLGDLLAGCWNAELFEKLKDVQISEEAMYRIAQLALVGWDFCGAGQNHLELERDHGVGDEGQVMWCSVPTFVEGT